MRPFCTASIAPKPDTLSCPISVRLVSDLVPDLVFDPHPSYFFASDHHDRVHSSADS
jgi:hypothetical protein